MNSNPLNSITTYPYPVDALPRSVGCALRAGTQPVQVFELETTLFAHFSATGSFELEIEFQTPIRDAVVRPQRHALKTTVAQKTVRIEVTHPTDLCVEVDGQKPFMIYIDDARQLEATPTDQVVRFKAGQLHDVGVLRVFSGQTIVIEAGAIVRGTIRADNASDIAITGRGIVDGQFTFAVPVTRQKLIQIEACKNVRVHGITMIRPAAWMLALADCEHAVVSHVRQIGEVVCSDGIDIVGSRHVHIHHCFLKNNDDCIAIKAIAGGDYEFLASDPAKDVFDILIEDCAFWNDKAGNVMEIGFETRCNRIHDIKFRNIDVMGGHGHGGIFTIHAGDRAVITDVLYEDIRIEHLWDRMIDFEIMHSRYSKDAQRGQIRNVTFRRIRTIKDIYNTLNLLGGRTRDHTIKGITFDDFQMDNVVMKNEDDLQLLTRWTSDIRFV